MRTTGKLGLACTVALVAALTGCGSDDDSAQATSTAQSAPTTQSAVDLQAHRFGRGETTEESLAGFAKSIELGVTTMELDIVLTKDKVPLVWHDPIVLDTKCSGEYVGKLIHDLTYEQVRTLDCGKKLADFPEQQAVAGNTIATLPQLFDLAKTYAAPSLRYNIETKVEAEKPEQSAAPQEFVDAILAAVNAAGVSGNVEIQSFDWRTLPLVRAAAPSIPLVALYDDTTFVPAGKWLGDIRYEDFPNDPLSAIAKLGANIASPDYRLIADKSYVEQAHAKGLKVVPWTVNDKADIAKVLDLGVDGIISDYPTRVREVFGEKGIPLPTAYPKR